jgi:hypothetical protein
MSRNQQNRAQRRKYANNPEFREKEKARVKAYREAHPEKVREWNQSYVHRFDIR